MNIRNFVPLTVLLLSATAAFAKQDFQAVLTLACADTTFEIDARAFAQNVAGSSKVALRYRYRGQRLKTVNYERYYKNLESLYLPDARHARVFALNLALDGRAHFGGTTETGDSLYLSPAAFTRAEFDAFAACIASEESSIRAAFRRVSIRSSTLLGLMRTESALGLHGIARVIYRESPVEALYAGAGYIFVVQSDGQVWLRSNFTSNNPAESVQLGTWKTPASASQQTNTRLAKAVLELQRAVRFQGQLFDVAALRNLVSAEGSLARDDFVWRWQTGCNAQQNLRLFFGDCRMPGALLGFTSSSTSLGCSQKNLATRLWSFAQVRH